MEPSSDKNGRQVLVDPQLAVVDICFIHGLGGGPISTWTKDGIFWPEKLLPKDIPDARIITWGYSAEVAKFLSPASASTISDHANSLLNDVSSVREHTQTMHRPLIFIAHSLGGIVCAKGLLNASLATGIPGKNIHERIKGVAFLGTPFRGSEWTSWSSILEKLMKFIFVQTNKGLINHLRPASQGLAELNDGFEQWIRGRQDPTDMRVRIMCFFEEDAPLVGGAIVDRQSSMIAGCETLSIPSDHIGMCKFSKKEDPGYQKILTVLRRWIDEIKKDEVSDEEHRKSSFSSKTTFSGPNYGGLQMGQDNSRGGTHHVGEGNTYNFGSK